MALYFLKNWKFESELSSARSAINSRKLQKCSIGIITDTDDPLQLTNLEKLVWNESKSSCLKMLVFSNKVSKQQVDFHYFKNDIQWAGVPKSQVVDDFLTFQFDLTYVFLDKLSEHQIFILELLKTKSVYAAYLPGMEKYATLMIETRFHDLVDKYQAIRKTLIELSPK